MNAGLEDNIVPGFSKMLLSCRYNYEDNIDVFFNKLYHFISKQEQIMQTKNNNSKIAIKERTHVLPFQNTQESNVGKFVKQCFNSTIKESVGYGTEAGYFQKMGIEPIIFGPGNILQAHKSNEFISLYQLRQFENFFINMSNIEKTKGIKYDKNSYTR